MNFRVVITCCSTFLIVARAVSIARQETSNPDEYLCSQELTEIAPNMPKFYADIFFNKTWSFEAFQRGCEFTKEHFMALQTELDKSRDQCPCLDEVEPSILISKHFASLLCQLDTKLMDNFRIKENFVNMLHSTRELSNCALNVSNDTNVNLFEEYCTLDEIKVFECSSKLFADNKTATLQTTFRTFWNLVNPAIACGKSDAEDKTKFSAELVINYIGTIMLPVILYTTFSPYYESYA